MPSRWDRKLASGARIQTGAVKINVGFDGGSLWICAGVGCEKAGRRVLVLRPESSLEYCCCVTPGGRLKEVRQTSSLRYFGRGKAETAGVTTCIFPAFVPWKGRDGKTNKLRWPHFVLHCASAYHVRSGLAVRT